MKLYFPILAWNVVPVVGTVIMHSLGTALIVVERPKMFAFVSQHRLFSGQVVTAVLIQLLVLHMLEIGFWGFWLRALGLFADLGTSLYFAGICYTTLGYNVAPPARGGAISEVLLGMLGLLTFGWSTGILITTVLGYEKVALSGESQMGP